MLEALECPSALYSGSRFLSDDWKGVQTLVLWLEDQKIRRLKEEDRAFLRVSGEEDEEEGVRRRLWEEAFTKYLLLLDCPYSLVSDGMEEEGREESGSLDTIMFWLLSFAVSCEFEDVVTISSEERDGADAMETSGHEKEEEEEEEVIISYSQQLDAIGALLSLPRQLSPLNKDKEGEEEDNVKYLERIANKIRLFLKKDSLQALQTALSSPPSSSSFSFSSSSFSSSSISDFPLGFDTGDETVNSIALVLRLLHVHDLRTLQQDVNSIVARAQQHTANP